LPVYIIMHGPAIEVLDGICQEQVELPQILRLRFLVVEPLISGQLNLSFLTILEIYLDGRKRVLALARGDDEAADLLEGLLARNDLLR
jgi:hypothetical protein